MEIRSLVYSHLLDKVEWATTHAMINSVIFPANDWDFGDDLINCYEIHNGKLYSYLTSQENLNFELVLSFLLKFYWYKSENFILSLIKIPEIKLILQGMDIRLLSGSHYSIDILKELVVNDNRKIYQLLNYNNYDWYDGVDLVELLMITSAHPYEKLDEFWISDVIFRYQ